MAVNTVRRLAADILNVGENRIRINPENIGEVKSAMTRLDVQALIDKGAIKALPKKGRRKKEKKRKRGSGSIKGGKAKKTKQEWMTKIRSQRRLISKLLELGVLPKEEKRQLYLKAKSGVFRSKKAMINYLKENEIIPADFEIPKVEFEKKPKPKPEKKPEPEKKSGEEKGEKK